MSESGEPSTESGNDGASMYTGVINKTVQSTDDTNEYQDPNESNRSSAFTSSGGKAVRGKKRQLQGFDRRNFILHQYFIRKEFDTCKTLIKEICDEHGDMCEYALYMGGKIARIEGNLREALIWFKRALSVNPSNSVNFREIGRLNFLLGNHVQSSEIFLDAIKLNPNDWKSYYWRAMALYHNKQDSESAFMAQECLLTAPAAAQRVEILMFLAKLCEQRNDITLAIEAQKKVLELEPENLDVLTNMGLLYARLQNDDQAFAAFGKALSYDPAHPQSILAAGSIIQTNGEHDVALTKYRIAAEKCEYNGPLWNNIGMCFFGRTKYVAAISCLKKANYFCPLEWKICYNLGLVHNAMQQYASAYHFLSSAINLNPRSAMAYMSLAVVLTNLGDTLNANKSYDRAVQFHKNNAAQILLNYAIFKAKQKEYEKSMKFLNAFYDAYANRPAHSHEMMSAADNLKRYLSEVAQHDITAEDAVA